MKGPIARKHRIRRYWHCPNCDRKTWTGGQVVALECRCIDPAQPGKPVAMQLVEEEPKAPLSMPESCRGETQASPADAGAV